ncbi:MAG TPA: hypothetical protein VI336_02020 [Candidatus Saccharimonadales bacterium]|nr:hypothetical protein [Candidatus Saccharimonadales bacterium]
MSYFEQEPGYGAEGEYIGSGELFDAILDHVEKGGLARLVIDMDLNDEGLRQKVDELRNAGAEIIVPQDN